MHLPVTGLTYGPIIHQDTQVSVEFKSLECFEYGAVVQRDNCNALRFVNATRLQFDLEYINGKDCSVEFAFQRDTDLTLTVSNFDVSNRLVMY